MLKYSDIHDEDITYMETMRTTEFTESRGDFDGDGKLDLILGATILPGKFTNGMVPGEIINLDEDFKSLNFIQFRGDETVGLPKYSSFLPDIDNDGKDEIVIVHRRSEGGEIFAAVTIILGKVFDNLPESREFHLGSIEPHQGIFIKGPPSRSSYLEMSVLSDVDSDGIPDLSVYMNPWDRESYVVLGADILDAIQAGSTKIDIVEQFRSTESQP